MSSPRIAEMTHPCRALRDPLNGARLAARQSRFRGHLGLDASLFVQLEFDHF